jgi:hypothetical protein
MPGQRTYGMDHDVYDWSPIVKRPVLTWPNGERVALVVIVNLEHYGWSVSEGTPLAVSPHSAPPRGRGDHLPVRLRQRRAALQDDAQDR